MIVPNPILVLEHNQGATTLTGSTLVVAIDDTGEEAFADPHFPVFGLGGCAVLVRDYQRLVEIPWHYMKRSFFPEFKGPLHAAELEQPTEEQIGAMRHFFEKFQFFRIAALTSQAAVNTTDFRILQILCESLLLRICEIGSWIPFDRCVMIIEESNRLDLDLMRFLSGKRIRRAGVEIPIELFLMPKRASFALLEVADFVIHTAGAQTRNRNNGRPKFRRDFAAVFQNVDSRLASFVEVTGVNLA